MKKLYMRFLLFFMVLTIVFTVGNIFLRTLPFINFSLLVAILWTSIPVMAVFTLPLAASLAVYFVTSNLVIYDEIIFISYLVSMKRSLAKAVAFFCIMTVCCYGSILFFLAPLAYSQSKKIFVGAIEQHIKAIPAMKLQQMTSGAAIYFSEKKISKNLFFVRNLFFSLKTEYENMLCCTSSQAELIKALLICKDGEFIFFDDETPIVLSFEKASLDLNVLIPNITMHKKMYNERTADLTELLTKSNELGMLQELYKRLSQLWWSMLLPFFSYCLAIIDRSKKNRFVRAVIINGLLFIASHCIVAAGYSYYNFIFISLSIVYGSGLIAFILLVTKMYNHRT